MTNWAPLDVALGLALVYFLLSLLASTIQEAIAAALGWRAKFLERWLCTVLHDPDKEADVKKTVGAFLASPLITIAPGKRGPSYIASDVFSAAALTAGGLEKLPETLDEAIAALPSPQLQRVARALCADGVTDVAQLRARLERWYDNSMERVSGWYKRRVQIVLAVIGLGLAILVNADTTRIAHAFWSDKTVRAAVVAKAGQVAQGGSGAAGLSGVANQVKQIKTLQLPLGWSLKKGDPRDIPHGAGGWVGKIVGLLLTALALTLGAPFWFDLLSKVARIRFSGAPPPTTGGTRSGEGDQTRAGPPANPPAPSPAIK